MILQMLPKCGQTGMELCHAEMEEGQNEIQSHWADEVAGNLIGDTIYNLGINVALEGFRYWQI